MQRIKLWLEVQLKIRITIQESLLIKIMKAKDWVYYTDQEALANQQN